jgi:Uma2 family endonuclease
MHRAASDALTSPETVADLLRRLGRVPAHRVRMHPAPGTATERDVLAADLRDGRICEVVDGVLIEKVMDFRESRLNVELITSLGVFLREHNLGTAVGPDGILKLTTGLVRVPDVSFVSWARLPGGKVPKRPVPTLPLDLAVEIVSKGNSRAEMSRKLREYFEAETRLVWFIFPKTKRARVYTGPKACVELDEAGVLDGGVVLPGFRLPLRELFACANREARD